MQEEYITEVDEHDTALGLKPRSDFPDKAKFHRTSALLLFNTKNQLLIQKRNIHKKWFPGLFDFSVSGVVADETYDDCIKRECKEEIGILPHMNFLFKITPKDDNGKAFQSVFAAISDEEIHFDKEEAEAVYWKDIEEIRKDIEVNSSHYTPQLRIAIQKYLDIK